MSTFNESAQARLARAKTPPSRRALWDQFEAGGLPSTDDEVWRYAPLDTFDLDRYLLGAPRVADAGSTIAAVRERAGGPLIHLVDGGLVATASLPAGLSVRVVDEPIVVDPAAFSARYGQDAFGLLNGALSPGTVVIEVVAGARLTTAVTVLNETTGAAAFPSVLVRLGARAAGQIVEYVVGGTDALVSSLSEYELDEGAHLAVTSCQRVAPTCWHVARTTAVLASDATLRQSSVGLGGRYNRSRNDAELAGSGAANELRTTFLGVGDQIHDFRTHQRHRAGLTTSELLSKGAVTDRARSVYTGLIEIEPGAKRTDARQRNFNLLLSPTAHADTVPNLDIKENDVLCAHASSVGPLDEEQRWYLESRGVARAAAERLLIQGFFYELTSQLPADVAALVGADVTAAIANAGAA